MTDLAAGTQVLAADFPPAVHAQDNTLISDITSQSWITGSPVVQVDFVASTTGRVVVTVAAGMRNGSSEARIACAPRISEVGGIILINPGVARYGISSSTLTSNYEYHSRTTLVEGLVPGRSYLAQFRYRVTGGNTADITTRLIHVKPAT